jgi:hypothetical protein
MRRLGQALLVVPLAGMGLAALAVPVASQPVAPRACAGWQVVPSPSPGPAGLAAVAATSATDAWAVGSRLTSGGSYRTLIEHWNGNAWKVVPSPDPAGGASPTDTLGGVVALSKTDAWAAGFYEKTTTDFRTLIEHWNGTRWSVVPSPNSGTGANNLVAMAAVSASDIWAVGFRQGTSGRRTLTEHWNGRRWAIVPSPNAGSGDNLLLGAAPDRAGGAWAVGFDSVSFGQALALHRTGSSWSIAPAANPGQGDRFLQAVTAPATRAALAVGSYLTASRTLALAERWNGSAWSRVPAASPGADYNSLQAAAATSTTSGWAVGTQRAAFGQRFLTLAEHWNGASWTAAASPSPGRGDDGLSGIAAIPHGGFWAVGTAGAATLTERHC